MLEWLIIGGGPHGIHIAAALLAKAGVPPATLRILDPQAALMGAWNRRAQAVGMSHLRSPSVHNVDVDPWSMHRFAESWSGEDPNVAPFSPPYSRPSTASMSPGTTPPCRSTSWALSRWRFFALVGGETQLPDALEDRLHRLRRHGLRSRGEREQPRGDLVDLLVGGLGRQHHGDQEGVGVAVVEGDRGSRVEFVEDPADLLGSFGAPHRAGE